VFESGESSSPWHGQGGVAAYIRNRPQTLFLHGVSYLSNKNNRFKADKWTELIWKEGMKCRESELLYVYSLVVVDKQVIVAQGSRSSKSSFKADLLRKPSVSLNLVLNFTFDGWLIIPVFVKLPLTPCCPWLPTWNSSAPA
jgi:hypothetical protein